MKGILGCRNKGCSQEIKGSNYPFQHSLLSSLSPISMLTGPCVEYFIQFWTPQYKTDIDKLEFSRGWPTMLVALEHSPCEGTLRDVGLLSQEKRRLQGISLQLKCKFCFCPPSPAQILHYTSNFGYLSSLSAPHVMNLIQITCLPYLQSCNLGQVVFICQIRNMVIYFLSLHF